MEIGQKLRSLLTIAEGATGADLMSAIRQARELAGEWWADAYVAQMAPVAWRTWESQTTILGASFESPVADLQYPHPVEVVGLMPIVVPIAPNVPAPGLVVPTLDDLLISVQWDQEAQATAAQDQTSTTGRSSFVTASSLSVDVPRLWCLRIESPTPVLTFQWRWKQGPNVFVDCVATVTTFVRPLPRRNAHGARGR